MATDNSSLQNFFRQLAAPIDLSTSALTELRSSEPQSLLDEIDSLRLQGISDFVFLPQIVVCGDQSSGKSSVLEAISGVPFPHSDTLCTRVATEAILAVVTAKNDINNQIILKRARDVDPEGLRTLGVITKPDTLPRGSKSEADFINLASNDDIKFCLGWHVVKNRDYDSHQSSTKERD
jgi:hypothetical protein